MKSLTGGEGYEVSYLLDNYDWASIDEIGGTVVDVGGSHGFVCVDLARRWKRMRFVVQDLPNMIAGAPKYDGDIGERIAFQAHDFMTEQPVRGADGEFTFLLSIIPPGEIEAPILTSFPPQCISSAGSSTTNQTSTRSPSCGL